MSGHTLQTPPSFGPIGRMLVLDPQLVEYFGNFSASYGRIIGKKDVRFTGKLRR